MSENIADLTPVCEAFRNFLFPFELISVYIPVLPKDMIDVLYSPVPFVMGIHKSLKNQALERLGAETCIVDLDDGKVFNYFLF